MNSTGIRTHTVWLKFPSPYSLHHLQNQVYSTSYTEAATHLGTDQPERCLTSVIGRRYDMAVSHFLLDGIKLSKTYSIKRWSWKPIHTKHINVYVNIVWLHFICPVQNFLSQTYSLSSKSKFHYIPFVNGFLFHYICLICADKMTLNTRQPKYTIA